MGSCPATEREKTMTRHALRPGRVPARRQRLADRLSAVLAVSILATALAACSLLPPVGGTGAESEFASTEPATAEEIKDIQTLLAERGYDPGPADGIMGPRTAAAIRRYQEDANLEPTGEATRGLLARLRDTATGPGRRPPRQPRTVVAAPEPVELGAPFYAVGDTYVFSHGISHTVLRVGADRVTWRDSRGDSFTTPLQVALPQIEWENGAWKGRNEATLSEGDDWPPAEGREVTFDVRSEEWNLDAGRGAERMVTEARWSCRNEGRGKVSVPAGEFEAAVIACERSPAPAGLWQRRVWHFAPALTHFVQRVDRDGSGIEIESIQLVAALPGTGSWPPAARAGLKMAMNAALSDNAVGEETAWRSTAVSEDFTVRVTAERAGAAGETCRNYVVVRTTGSHRQAYPGLACRAPGGEWRTPGYDGGVVGAGLAAGNG